MSFFVAKEEKEKEEVPKDRVLVDIVFSWSLRDVLNKDLYKGQVQQIPDTFMSATHYLKSFLPSLIEETRADLASSVESVSRLPFSQVISVEKRIDFEPPKDLFYEITLAPWRNKDAYEPRRGDLVALTDVKPRSVDDLSRPRQPYLIAFVEKVSGGGDTLAVISSKPITVLGCLRKKSGDREEAATLFAVCLTSLMTNIRICNALCSEFGGQNTGFIEKVARYSHDDDDCCICSSRGNEWIPSSLLSDIASFNLNGSQEAAVMSSIAKSDCFHRISLKLIWGPPGTGKTKTIACILYSLLRMKCRTLTCAPTNIAVVQVAACVLKSAAGLLGNERYRIGDMVLFGNQERMKIDDSSGLLDIFLDNRVDILAKCLAPMSGWNHILKSLECLLVDYEGEYQSYLRSMHRENEDTLSNGEKEGKEFKNDNWTFEEFIKKRLEFIGDRFKFCIVNLCKHLPTSFLSPSAAKNMINALDLLKAFETSLQSSSTYAGEGLLLVLRGVGSRADILKLCNARRELIHMLSLLPHLSIESTERSSLTKFCLSNACLLFCTASGAANSLIDGLETVQMLVIDEAAQLKECESAIPLQFPGLRHAILAGDERQLAAMVTSQISSKARFGRSLFERLVNLGSKKHLLNIQYRMHPSISLFSNTNFYDGRIMDAPNVKDASYQRRFLEGNMFGFYSFINIAQGIEDRDRKSMRNMVEVAVIDDIVARLYQESIGRKNKLSVGVIAPYKAQIEAIEARIGKYSADHSDFSVNIRSVDGFQGGEEDVIIFSTVRCNRTGNVGFLADERRVNVALTRARYCLWILGNGPTLVNSRSIWTKLVNDAKQRRCYYIAEEDRRLSGVITFSLIELGLLHPGSALFRNVRWKVILCDGFVKSIKAAKDPGACGEAISMLQKLADGWRPSSREEGLSAKVGTSTELLKHCRVTEHLSIIWTVDIHKEDLFQTQVMRVWTILNSKDVKLLSDAVDMMFSNYPTKKMKLCQYKRMELNLVVPMRWPVDRPTGGAGKHADYYSDSASLSRHLAAVNLNQN